MRNSLYSITMEEALCHIGGHHKYQRRLLWLTTATWSIWLILFQSLRDSSLSHYLLLSLGVCLGAFMLTALAGCIGRRLTTIVSQLMGNLMVLVVQVCPLNVGFHALMGLIGFFAAGALVNSYLLSIEVVVISHRNRYNSIIFSSYGLATVCSTFLYIFDCPPLISWTTLGVSGLFLGLTFLKTEESPRFVAAVKGKYSSARKILNTIAEINEGDKFTDILEGEKVIGNQEVSCPTSDRISSTNPHSRKYSYIHISDNVVSVTAPELPTVKVYGPLHVCYFPTVRKAVFLLFLVGVVTGYASSALNEALWNEDGYPPLLLGCSAAVFAMLSTYYLVNAGSRFFALIVYLGLIASISVVWFIFAGISCGESTYCTSIRWVMTALLSFGNMCNIGCVAVLFLMSAEMLQTNIRSAGMAFVLMSFYGGMMLNPAYWQHESSSVSHSVGAAGLATLVLCIVLCYLPDDEGHSMDDYIEEDKNSMNEPQEVSNINISVSHIEGIGSNELEGFDAEISLDS